MVALIKLVADKLVSTAGVCEVVVDTVVVCEYLVNVSALVGLPPDELANMEALDKTETVADVAVV